MRITFLGPSTAATHLFVGIALASALLTATVARAEVPLPPGAYTGHAPGGPVGFELRADGTATLGGAPVGWRRDGDTLVITPGAGSPYVVRVTEEAGGVVLVGPPFGWLRLEPAGEPAATAPPVPLPWVGAWLHRATGGALVLHLRGDRTYTIEQRGVPGPAAETTGRWQGEGTRLTLTPTDGAPLDYTARRDGDALVVGGGDLPGEVRFVPDGPR